MSHGEELFALGGDVATEPSFESALRGYEKKQVDRYVARAEHEIATLAAEREQAYTQIHKLAGQVEVLQRDLAQVRKQVGVVDRASFRHLGPASSRSSPSPRSRPRTSCGPPTRRSSPGGPPPSTSSRTPGSRPPRR